RGCGPLWFKMTARDGGSASQSSKQRRDDGNVPGRHAKYLARQCQMILKTPGSARGGLFVSPGRRALPPAERRRDVLQDRFDDMGVVVDAELVRHRQQ